MAAALKKLKEKVWGESFPSQPDPSRCPDSLGQRAGSRNGPTRGEKEFTNGGPAAGSPGQAPRESTSPPEPGIREPMDSVPEFLGPDVTRDFFPSDSGQGLPVRTRNSIDCSPNPDIEFREQNALNVCGIEVLAERISEGERHQLEIFFKGLKTEIYVCESPVNLYAGSKDDNSWTYKHTGLIVVILDCGRTRSRSKRKIHILLAERGTCFPLWRDTIDNLSAYHKASRSFHSMHLSTDHRQVIGLSFDSPSEAEKLLAHIERLTSNPENINIFVPGSGKKARNMAHKGVTVLPPKKHISNPCLFEHVNNVSARDRPLYASLRTLTGISDDRGSVSEKKEGRERDAGSAAGCEEAPNGKLYASCALEAHL